MTPPPMPERTLERRLLLGINLGLGAALLRRVAVHRRHVQPHRLRSRHAAQLDQLRHLGCAVGSSTDASGAVAGVAAVACLYRPYSRSRIETLRPDASRAAAVAR